MDIRLSQREKRMIRLGKSLLCKKLGTKSSPENIHKYLLSSKCDAIVDLVKLINFVSDNTKSYHQSIHVKEYGEFALYIAINHPDFRVMLEGLLSKFSKYNNVKIDLKPNITKIDLLVLNLGLKYIINKMSERQTYTMILNESTSSINKFARYFLSNADDAVKELKNTYLLGIAKSLIWIAIWIGINDTAYRHQFYYALYEIGNSDIKKISEEFYHKPNDWFINIYQEGRDETIKAWENNELPKHKVSIIEEPCILELQTKKVKNFIKKEGVK